MYRKQTLIGNKINMLEDKMEYKTYKVKEKPNKAPKEFCVYEYNNEEYVISTAVFVIEYKIRHAKH